MAVSLYVSDWSDTEINVVVDSQSLFTWILGFRPVHCVSGLLMPLVLNPTSADGCLSLLLEFRWFWLFRMTPLFLDTETTSWTPWGCGLPRPPVTSTSKTVSFLGFKKLVCEAEMLKRLDCFHSFCWSSVNVGGYIQAVLDRNLAENISRVLYPNDNVSPSPLMDTNLLATSVRSEPQPN